MHTRIRENRGGDTATCVFSSLDFRHVRFLVETSAASAASATSRKPVFQPCKQKMMFRSPIEIDGFSWLGSSKRKDSRRLQKS